MGLRYIGKGDIVIRKQDFDRIRRYGYGAKSSADGVVAIIENANGPSKDSPFREGLLCQACKDAAKTVCFLDTLIKVLDGAN